MFYWTFGGRGAGHADKKIHLSVALYQETRNKSYKNAGSFEIVSVAIETKEANWRKAIQSDGLTWKYQIGEMDRFSSPIATLYGVREIPTKYFISPEGRILMVNPKVEEILNFLKEDEELN